MRQSRPFPPLPPQPPPEPGPPLSRVQLARQALVRAYTRFRSVLLFGAGILIALGTVAAYDMTKPPPQRLTQRDIDRAVERSLATATPRPFFASEVYETIRPSLVQVRALIPGASKEG